MPWDCWAGLADVNLGNALWPPASQRCAYRHATLRRAQLACERTSQCVGIGRDNGLPCMAAGNLGTVPLRFELRGLGRKRWVGMKAWVLSRNASGPCQQAMAEGASIGACLVRAEAELRSSGDVRRRSAAGESASPATNSPDAFDLAEIAAGRCLPLVRVPREGATGGGSAGGFRGRAHCGRGRCL